MSDHQNGQKTRRDPNVFDDNKLYLYSKPANSEARAARFRIKLYENNPVIDIDYGTKTDKGYAMTHETPIDPIEFGVLMGWIELASRTKASIELSMDNWGFPFIWDKELRKNVRAKERMNISMITVGRRDNGEVFIRYKTFRNEVEFTFGENSDWHRYKLNGENMPVGQISSDRARSWVETMRDVYRNYFGANWAEPEWKKKKRIENMQRAQGNGNNNYNRNNNGGNNGYQQQQQQQQSQQTPRADFDNEIPDEEDYPY